MSREKHTQLNFEDIIQQLSAFTNPNQNESPRPGAEPLSHSSSPAVIRPQHAETIIAPMPPSSHIPAPSSTNHPSNLTPMDHLARLREITAAAQSQPQSTPSTSNAGSGSAPSTSSSADGRGVTNAPPTTTMGHEIDPATIFEWPAALRHVSKLGAKGDDLMLGVKQMIKDQRGNERDWWAERARRKAALGTTDDMHPELRAYDKKLLKALDDMQAVFAARLKSLGVPFFGVSTENITKAGEDEVEGKVTQAKLHELQQKMIDYLEAMYGD